MLTPELKSFHAALRDWLKTQKSTYRNSDFSKASRDRHARLTALAADLNLSEEEVLAKMASLEKAGDIAELRELRGELTWVDGERFRKACDYRRRMKEAGFVSATVWLTPAQARFVKRMHTYNVRYRDEMDTIDYHFERTFMGAFNWEEQLEVCEDMPMPSEKRSSGRHSDTPLFQPTPKRFTSKALTEYRISRQKAKALLRQLKPDDKPTDVFVRQAVSVIRRRCFDNPMSYLEYGPYWPALKSVLHAHGVISDRIPDPWLADVYAGENEAETLVMAEAFRDFYLATQFQGARTWRLNPEAEWEWTSVDDAMSSGDELSRLLPR